VTGISSTVGVEEKIFRNGVEDFVQFSLTHTRNGSGPRPVPPWPHASSDQGTGTFLRVAVQTRS